MLDAVDEPRHRTVCLLGDRPCHLEAPCAVHEQWTALRERAEQPYRTTTIAALLGARGRRTMLE